MFRSARVIHVFSVSVAGDSKRVQGECSDVSFRVRYSTNMELEQTWYPYEAGETMGKRGAAGGQICQDEEWGDSEEPEDADARITLETLHEAGWAVTVNLYGGWLQETARFSEALLALKSYEAAKSELARLSEFIPDEDTRNLTGAIETLNQEVAAFVIRFGGEPTV